MAGKTIPYDELKQRSLPDPDVKAAYDDLEPAHQVARLRIMRGLTQKELADLVGTKQPSIARLESGGGLPRLSFLRRVVEALGGRVILTRTSPWRPLRLSVSTLSHCHDQALT